MKILKSLPFLALLLLASCGGHNSKTDPKLSPIQNEAVASVRAHLEKKDKLMEYKVVEEIMPAAILEQPFLNLRNAVFKAGLDYQSCKTRGLETGMETAMNKIDAARQQVLETENTINNNIGDSKSIIVLGKIKTPKSHDGNLQSLVVVFDNSTMEIKEWIPVTTPVQNTVALVVCANDNTLAEYAKEQNHDTKVLAGKVNDPVLKFVLEANPL